MTEEELKGLTMGDKVYVRAVVSYVDKDGIECRVQIYGADGDDLGGYVKAADLYRAVPGKAEAKPKHDPCRLLKTGDKVQVKKRNGRCNGKAGEYLLEAFCEVAEDEVPNERVRVFHNSSEYRLDPAYLELITPVEERMPYSVKETMSHDGWQVVRDGLPLAIYDSRRHPNAKAAAEDEAARLNAEYRKKVGTSVSAPAELRRDEEVPCSEEGKERNDG